VNLDLNKINVDYYEPVQIENALENVIKRDLMKQSWEYLSTKLDATLTTEIDENSVCLRNVPSNSSPKILASPQSIVNSCRRPFTPRELPFATEGMSKSITPVSNDNENQIASQR